jgi:hypothetical protein
MLQYFTNIMKEIIKKYFGIRILRIKMGKKRIVSITYLILLIFHFLLYSTIELEILYCTNFNIIIRIILVIRMTISI